METVILLFLLASLDKDSSLQNSLRNFLGFYKQNRELIAMLTQTARQGEGARPQETRQAEQPADAPKCGTDEKKSRPEGTASLDILDEYLKRCAI